MEEQTFKAVQQAAKRNKQSLIWQILYLLIFISVSGYLLSRMLPVYYYKYSHYDKIEFKETDQPAYIRYNILTEQKVTRSELYRNDWFDLTQTNLKVDPFMIQYTNVPFGKVEGYVVNKRVGYQDYPVGTVKNRYVFSALTDVTYEKNDGTPQAQLARYLPQRHTNFASLVKLLQENGDYRVANIKVELKVPQKRAQVDELFSHEAVELLRYGVDYPKSESFGYPATYVVGFDNRNYYSEADFKQKLAFLTAEFSRYGNLFLTNQPDNFSHGMDGFIGHQDISLRNQSFLTGNTIDFADVNDYLDHNGIQYKRLYLTGSCLELATWLEKNQELFLMLEIEEMMDWNGTLQGRDDDFES